MLHSCIALVRRPDHSARFGARADARLGAFERGGRGEPIGGGAASKWSPEACRRREIRGGARAQTRGPRVRKQSMQLVSLRGRRAHQEHEGGLRSPWDGRRNSESLLMEDTARWSEKNASIPSISGSPAGVRARTGRGQAGGARRGAGKARGGRQRRLFAGHRELGFR